jgi:hypothetical protein
MHYNFSPAQHMTANQMLGMNGLGQNPSFGQAAPDTEYANLISILQKLKPKAPEFAEADLLAGAGDMAGAKRVIANAIVKYQKGGLLSTTNMALIGLLVGAGLLLLWSWSRTRRKKTRRRVSSRAPLTLPDSYDDDDDEDEEEEEAPAPRKRKRAPAGDEFALM